MSGEQDIRPDLGERIKTLERQVYELSRRISGDENPLALNDLEDVRVDSLGDVTITLADGNALVYRASDGLWIPGSAAGGFPISYDDGTYTYEITAVGGLLRISVTENADPTNIVTFDLLPPQASISVVNAFDLIATDPSSVINIHATDAGSIISIEAGDVVEINTGGTDGNVSIGNPNNKTTDIVSERVRFFQNVPTANGNVLTSSFVFWLDDTPGATTLNVKAKDSAGTVRTASVPLT